MNSGAILAQSFQRLSAGDPQGAERVLAPLWNASPRKPAQAMHLMALIRSAQGRTPEAEQLLRNAIAAEPRDPEQHANLGSILVRSGRAEEAARAFGAALSLSPAMPAAQFGLAQALVNLKRGPEAEVAAHAFLARTRGPEGLHILGAALGLQDRHDEALAMMEEALALKPDYPPALHDRAIALHRLNRGAEALAAMDELLARGLQTAELFSSTGTILTGLGRIDDAIERFAEGVRVYPCNAGLHADLARLRWMRGENAETFAAPMTRAIADNPDDIAMRLSYAELLNRAGRRDDAESAVRAGLDRAPGHAKLWAMLGYLQDEDGAVDDAAVSLDRAMSIAPDQETRKLFAHALMRSGDADRALEHIRAGLESAPHDQIWLCNLATAQRMRGDPEFERLYQFDRFVQVFDIEPPAPFASVDAFNDALAARLDALHVLNQHPLNQTLREGTQTPKELTKLNDPIIDAFLTCAREAGRKFAASLPHDPAHPFAGRGTGDVKFSGSWSVRLKPGGHHVNHVHHMGWISSAYYVRLPTRRAEDDPHAGWLKFGEPRIPIPACTPLKWVEPKVGRLVLFPSYMWHGTEPFTRDDRLTIAFDMVPT